MIKSGHVSERDLNVIRSHSRIRDTCNLQHGFTSINIPSMDNLSGIKLNQRHLNIGCNRCQNIAKCPAFFFLINNLFSVMKTRKRILHGWVSCSTKPLLGFFFLAGWGVISKEMTVEPKVHCHVGAKLGKSCLSF